MEINYQNEIGEGERPLAHKTSTHVSLTKPSIRLREVQRKKFEKY